KQVVTGGQLFNTNTRVTSAEGDIDTAQADITTLQGQVGNLGTSVTTNSLNVGSGALVASSTGVTVATDLNMGGNKITGLVNGTVSATSTEAVTGQQLYNYLIDADAPGIRYFHANSIAPDSQANGLESVAIGPNTVADGVSSFA